MAIDRRAVDSKVTVSDLREVMEDERGIVVRDALYNELATYFDLDRSGQVYIGSFCSFLRDPTISHFNFFKVNPAVITKSITDYVRNCLASKPDDMKRLEEEFKSVIFNKSKEEEEKNPEESNAEKDDIV